MTGGPHHPPLSVSSSVLLPAVFSSCLQGVGRGDHATTQAPPPRNPATDTGSWVAPVSLVTRGWKKRTGSLSVEAGGESHMATSRPMTVPHLQGHRRLCSPQPEEGGDKRTTLSTCPSPAAFLLFLCPWLPLLPLPQFQRLGGGVATGIPVRSPLLSRCWGWPLYPLPGHLFWF